MKTDYIIFSNQKPKNKQCMMEVILHYCRKHLLDYSVLSGPIGSRIKIEGYVYSIVLEERQELSASSYWMIHCLLKHHRLSHQKLAVSL